MSAADNFESLSNAELRSQLLKYGLINVPVTDSSRNVIIKKLRAATSGGIATPTKKQNRRETIAVVERASPVPETSKIVETASATPTRSRRTIAAAASKDEAAAEMPARRRSVNETQPSKEQRRVVRDSPVPKSKTPALIVLDSDDEDDVVAALDKVEQQQRNANTRRSTSRTPSLTKTAVVTAAYNQNLMPLVEETGAALQEFGDNLMSAQLREDIDAVKVARNDFLQQQQQKLQKEKELQQQVEHQKLLQQLQQQKQQREQQHEERISNYASLYKESAALPATAPRYTSDYQTPLESTTISTASTLSAFSSTASRYNAQPVYPRATNIYPRLDKVAKYSRGSLAASSGYATRTSAYNEYSDDADLLNAEEDDEKLETPFLSNFARNLNRLKAEPIGGKDLTPHYRRARTAQEVTGRVSVHRLGQAHNSRNLMQRFTYWNRKYNLSQHFFLLLVLIIVAYTVYKFWQ